MMALSHRAYKVGWICALPLELTAAQAMLDELHPQLDQPQIDTNTYTLGKISHHNVVVACLPSGVYGTTSAATVLTHMRHTFPALEFTLMVGIGGGVPNKITDIRLGDVIVSIPTSTSGGVIQYDYGKILHGNQHVCSGSLNKPPQSLLTAISKLRSTCTTEGGLLGEGLSNILKKHYGMEKQFSRPDKDWLFNSDYVHPNNDLDCSECDQSQLRQRVPRVNANPHIHYGSIASGNQVMKDANMRDSIAQDLGIICFEMEAAGLMDQLPCLVIRGVSDYCDSHKSKHWQGYAALTASSYARKLLSSVPHRKDSLLLQNTLELPPPSASIWSSTTFPTAQRPLFAFDSQILDDQKGSVKRGGKCTTENSIPSINAVSRMTSCSRNCTCDCHKKQRIQFPPSRNSVIGTFFIRYSGTTFFRRNCNSDTCKNDNPGFLEAVYCSPRWLVDITFILSGGPSYGLFIPRRLGWGSTITTLKAAYEGNIESLKLLLSNSKFALHDIDQKHGRTALHYAVMHNHIEVCEFLRNASANVHAMDHTGMTPTIKAWEHILTGRGSTIQLENLRRLFPDIDFCDDMGFSHIHLLVVGVLYGNLTEALEINEYRRHINDPDTAGQTPLHWAATRGDFEKVQILLEYGATVDARDKSGATPLMFAASSGCGKSLRLLLQEGSDVRARNSYGSEALYYACRHQSEVAPVTLLLRAGACTDSRNNNGHTALIGAAIRNHVKIGRFLLRQGAAIDAKGANGETALFEAIFHNRHQFLTLLLQSSADCNVINNSGSTILHSTALEGDCETAGILLNANLISSHALHRNKLNFTPLEMMHRRSIIPEGFEDIFSRLLLSVGNRGL